MTAIFLTALAFLNPSGPPLGDFKPTDLITILNKSGYVVNKVQDDLFLELKRKDHQGVWQISVLVDQKRRITQNTQYVSSLLMRADYVVTRDLDVSAPYVLQSATKDNIETKLRQHLGNIVSAQTEIKELPTMSEKELIEAVNFVWDGIERDAKQPGGKLVPYDHHLPKLDKKVDNRFFRVDDDLSLQFLVNYWGWYPKHAWGGSSPVWFIHADIDGYHCYLNGIQGAPSPNNKFNVRVNLSQVSSDQAAWILANLSRFPGLKVYDGNDKQDKIFYGEVTLDRKTKVSDVKKQIQAIVDQVKQVDKEVRK